jgi:hypothetical protein
MQPTLTPSDLDRFWSKVHKTTTCWGWTGSRSQDGYGHFAVWHTPNRWVLRAHRVAFELATGPISETAVLDHICRVRHCVNPEHLRAVTPRENVLAGIGISALNARKTHCKRGHEFTPENTYRTSKGGRQCVSCKAALDSAASDRRGRKRATCETCGSEVLASNLARHQKKLHSRTEAAGR